MIRATESSGVPGIADPGDQFALHQSVKHSCDIGRPVDHPPGDLVPRVPFRVHAAQDAQDVGTDRW